MRRCIDILMAMMLCFLLSGELRAQDDVTLLKAAHRGSVSAMRRIGMRMYRGRCSRGNPSIGIRWLEKAVEKGDAEAMYCLGRIYQNKGNEKLAAEYLEQAMEAGYDKAAAAMEKMSLKYSLERVTEKAETGNHKACMRLLKAYLLGGDGVSIDTDEAFEWYEQAVKIKGKETRETIKKWNVAQTAPLWEKIVDDHEDDEEALMYLAELFEKGADGVPKDENKARKYYQESASAGNLQAAAWLKERGIPFETKAERDERLAREAEQRQKAEEVERERKRREQELAIEKHRNLFRSLLRDHGRERVNFLCCDGYDNPHDEEVSLGKLSTMNEFNQFYLQGRVYQKISDSRFLTFANGTTISVVVPPDVKINFADKDLVHGIFMRDGSYSYETVSGQWKEVRNYMIVADSIKVEAVVTGRSVWEVVAERSIVATLSKIYGGADKVNSNGIAYYQVYGEKNKVNPNGVAYYQRVKSAAEVNERLGLGGRSSAEAQADAIASISEANEVMAPFAMLETILRENGDALPYEKKGQIQEYLDKVKSGKLSRKELMSLASEANSFGHKLDPRFRNPKFAKRALAQTQLDIVTPFDKAMALENADSYTSRMIHGARSQVDRAKEVGLIDSDNELYDLNRNWVTATGGDKKLQNELFDLMRNGKDADKAAFLKRMKDSGASKEEIKATSKILNKVTNPEQVGVLKWITSILTAHGPGANLQSWRQRAAVIGIP